MAFGEGIFSWTSIFVITVVATGIWIIIEIQRFKHKIFAIFLILLLISGYVSFAVVYKGNDIDLTSIPEIIDATKIYLLWLGSTFVNLKSVTANALKLYWSTNKTS